MKTPQEACKPTWADEETLARKTNQVNAIKLVLAFTLFIGAIMEVDLPQPNTTASIKMDLDCPLVSKTMQDHHGLYQTKAQYCY